MAAILADRELERLLAYLELPTELPKTAPARSPPFTFDEEGLESDRGITRGSVASEVCWEAPQVNPLADLHGAIDDPAGEELTPA